MISYLPWRSPALLPNSFLYITFWLFFLNLRIHCVIPLKKDLRHLALTKGYCPVSSAWFARCLQFWPLFMKRLPVQCILLHRLASLLQLAHSRFCALGKGSFCSFPPSLCCNYLHDTNFCLFYSISTWCLQTLFVLSKSCVNVSLYLRTASCIPPTFSSCPLLSSLHK